MGENNDGSFKKNNEYDIVCSDTVCTTPHHYNHPMISGIIRAVSSFYCDDCKGITGI